jgi:hypothetical protein
MAVVESRWYSRMTGSTSLEIDMRQSGASCATISVPRVYRRPKEKLTPSRGMGFCLPVS